MTMPHPTRRFVSLASSLPLRLSLPSLSPRKLLIDLEREGFGVHLIGDGGASRSTVAAFVREAASSGGAALLSKDVYIHLAIGTIRPGSQ